MGVSVRGLGKRFDSEPVLEDVSFDVPDGRLLSVLGPSGSGKTTLLRCIAGVETPDAGSIKIGEKTVYDRSGRISVPPEDRGIGMVFQSNALWPHMTVKKNVAYPLEIRGESEVDARVGEVLSLLKMDRLAGRYPSEISGGEQQRVAIARAIVYRPSLVLLDEPFSNLDALLRESLRDELRQLQLKLAMTMVYVTHDRVDALSLGDEVALLSGGRMVAKGAPDSLLREPPNSYAARFLGGMLVIDAEATPLGGGKVHIVTPYGTFEASSALTSRKVNVCVPPSAASFTATGSSLMIPGTVSGIVRFPSGFMGVRVVTDAGPIELHSERVAELPAAGGRVSLHVDPRQCVLVEN